MIAATTTEAGLTVRSAIDTNTYPRGVKGCDAEMTALNLHPHNVHSDWNYTIKPQDKTAQTSGNS